MNIKLMAVTLSTCLVAACNQEKHSSPPMFEIVDRAKWALVSDVCDKGRCVKTFHRSVYLRSENNDNSTCAESFARHSFNGQVIGEQHENDCPDNVLNKERLYLALPDQEIQ